MSGQDRLEIEIVPIGEGMLPTAYGKGLAILRHFVARLDRTGWPLVELELIVEDGRASCERVEFRRRSDGEPLTASSIRRVGIGDAMEWAIKSALMKVSTTGKPGVVKISAIGARDIERTALEKVAVRHARRRASTERSPTAKDQATAVQRVERERKRGPGAVERVAEQMGFSRATIYRLLRRARGED